jgi:(S)-2-hydroxyglutarate dehydrogenase
LQRYDVVVIGAGIVGLASALALKKQKPGAKVLVIDKEGSLAGHQTGRNSGVIHAGVYYKPGSEKARLCTAGRNAMVEFCRSNGVAHEVCGKVVVAASESERTKLDELYRRCVANGVDVEAIGAERLRELEPHAVGVSALHVKVTGIADYRGVCEALVRQLTQLGTELRMQTALLSCVERPEGLVLSTTTGDVIADRVMNCAGLHADRVAELISGKGVTGGLQIVPFRGEYFELAPAQTHLVKNLIYPVPDPRFPFLGVHLTRGVNGRIHAGPNAVLAFAREGYSWGVIDRKDLLETLRFRGFHKLAAQYWKYGASEMVRSASKELFARALQKLVPAVEAKHLEPAPAGVRAQALRSDGSLVDDFAFVRSGRALHVLNAPSPAATAALAIGEEIARTLYK